MGGDAGGVAAETAAAAPYTNRTLPRPFPAGADPAELERRARLEIRLADRLRRAGAEDRKALVGEVYAEYAREVGDGVEDDAGSLALQQRVLGPWLAPEATLVEVGAGSGALAVAVAGSVRRVVAIEAVIPEAATSAVEWVTLDAADGLDEAFADIAYSCHVVEHLHPDDLQAHLELVRRWLRPGRPYVAITPNRLYGPHDVSGYFHDEPRGFHLREYSHGDLARAARRAGFDRVVAVRADGSARALGPIVVAEAILGFLPRGARRRLVDHWRPLARRAPLRPLEQVAIAAFAP